MARGASRGRDAWTAPRGPRGTRGKASGRPLRAAAASAGGGDGAASSSGHGRGSARGGGLPCQNRSSPAAGPHRRPGELERRAGAGRRLMQGERRGRGEKKEREGLTGGPHSHVASTSAKPHSKPPGWPNVTGFESWMVKATRFWSWMAKIKLGQELDGQKWTLPKKISSACAAAHSQHAQPVRLQNCT